MRHQSDVFEIILEKLPEEWALAEDLTEIVRSEPRTSADSAKRCIDKALVLSFTFAGEHLDLEKDLIERPPPVTWRDKWPGWLRELTPQQKCEVGQAMAHSGLGGLAFLYNPKNEEEDRRSTNSRRIWPVTRKLAMTPRRSVHQH